MVGSMGCWTLPERVVEGGGDGGLLSLTDALAGVVVPAAGEEDSAELAAADALDGLDDLGPASALGSELDDAVEFSGGSDHEFPFVGVMAGGFFDVDVFTGGASENGCGRVPMIRGGNDDGVDGGVIECFADVFDGGGGGLLEFGEGGVGLSQALVIDFAEVGDAAGGQVCEALHETGAACEAHDGDVDEVWWGLSGGERSERRSRRQGGGEGGGLLNELPTVDG